MRFWLTLTGVLLFAAGVAVGFLAPRGHGSPGGRPDMPFDIFDPEAPARLLTSKEVYQELDLSEEQRSRIDSLVAENKKRARDIRELLGTLATDLRQGLEDVLTPEQRGRFEAIKQRIEEGRIEGRVNRKVEELRGEIGLTAEQVAQVTPLFMEAEREKGKCWKSGRHKGNSEAVRKEMEEISRKRDERLAAVLSEEQFKKYRELKDRERRRWDRRR